MDANPCHAQRAEVEAALREWERIKGSPSSDPEVDPVGNVTPPMGGDLGSRFYETIGRKEAAQRRYRTAVRSLAECLRSHRGNHSESE